MGEADRLTIASGVSGSSLMENAGRAVADAIRKRVSPLPVVVLCGPGNNGGDGFVAARILKERGWPVRLSLLGEKGALKGEAKEAAGAWSGAVEPLRVEALDGAGLVVDALFGAGLARPIEGVARAVIAATRERALPVVAIDIPSGIDGASGEVRGIALGAGLTVTFFRKKPGHLLLPGRLYCGKVVLAEIGIGAEVLDRVLPQTAENDPLCWLEALPQPTLESHKYTRGHALVGGGAVMTGAARLSALAAARSGAGLVTLAAPEKAFPIYASSLLSVIVKPISGTDEWRELLADPRRNTALIGPGAIASEETREKVLAVLAAGKSAVLDADALNAFKEAPKALFEAIRGPCVLTPHEGEFARLFRVAGKKTERALRAAKETGAVILLKGADTVIASPDGRVAINANAPPQLATGGSGDVLSGIVLGLLAQGMEPFPAACAAAWIHGDAARRVGPGLVAEDLLPALPATLSALYLRRRQMAPSPGALPA